MPGRILDGEMDLNQEDEEVTLYADPPSPQETLIADTRPVFCSLGSAAFEAGRPISLPFVYNPTEEATERVRRFSGDTQKTLDEHPRDTGDTLRIAEKPPVRKRETESSSAESLIPPRSRKSSSFRSSSKSISLSDVSRDGTLESGKKVKEIGGQLRIDGRESVSNGRSEAAE